MMNLKILLECLNFLILLSLFTLYWTCLYKTSTRVNDYKKEQETEKTLINRLLGSIKVI